MQRSPRAKFFPLTATDLEFIERAIARCTFDPEDDDEHLLFAELKSFLIHPEQVTIDEVCLLVPKLRSIDRITLLNARPTLLKDAYDLVDLLRSIYDPEERFLLACSQIDKIFTYNAVDISQNIIMLATEFAQARQLAFCKFALSFMIKEISNRCLRGIDTQENKVKSQESLTITFLFRLLASIGYFDKSTPVMPVVALLGAMARTTKSVVHTKDGERLKLQLWQTYSLWKSAAIKSNPELTRNPSAHHKSSPKP